MISSPIFRVSSVTRYSTLYQIRPETLSEHVVDTSYMAYMIARNMIVLGESIDMGLLLTKTLIHDFDEPLVGDIPRVTKYSTEECHKELNKVANLAAEEISKEIDGTDYSYQIWSHDKDLTQVEGLLMKVVDMLSVVKKAITEVDILGNMNFLKIVEEVKNYVEDLLAIDYNVIQSEDAKQYLLDIIKGAYELLDEVSHNYEHKRTSYTMYDSITDRLVARGVSSKF